MSPDSESYFVKCTQCGAKNRIPSNRLKDKAVCGRCKNPLSLTGLFPNHFVPVGDHSFKTEVMDFPGPVVVYVWAPWCGYCRRLSPTLDQMVRNYSGRIKFTKLSLDQNPLIASQYSIQGVPTLLLFKGGHLVDRLFGEVPGRDLEYAFRKLL